MTKLVGYIIPILLFLGPTVYAYLGWQVEGSTSAPIYQQFYPAYFIIFFTLTLYYFYNLKLLPKIKLEYIITILIISIWTFLKLIKGSSSVMILFNSVGLPVLCSALYITIPSSEQRNKRIRFIVILMFLAVIFLALFERLVEHHVFPLELAYEYADISGDVGDYFRSSSLLGHPLSNALIISCVMAFILISDISTAPKYFLFMAGFMSLLCFNSRASIMMWAGFLPLYMGHNIFRGGISTKTKIFLISIAVLLILSIIFMFEMGWGGRLFQKSLGEDNSTFARILAWDIFEKFDISIFLIGMQGDLADFALRAIGTVHVENWFIYMAMRIGVIFSILCTIMIYLIIKKSLIGYTKFQKIFVLAITFLLASTNNSLACGVQVISIFIICTYAFTSAESKIIKEKL